MVYADLSLSATPAIIPLKEVYVGTYKAGALSADHDHEGVDVVNYILDDPEKGKMKFYSDIIPSSQNLAYNQEARKRSHFKLQKNINVNAIKQSLHNIFTWIPGERILNPEFGSKLRKYLYEGITNQNKELIMAEIQKCITQWEPRVQLVRVVDTSTVNDTENNTVKIDIIYIIPSLSFEQYVYTYEVPQIV